jgi:DNA-binding Lrp family transcriptional regulator
MVHLKEHAQSVLKNFVRECVKFSEVMECYHLTGDFDFLLKIAIRDMDEYNDFLIHKLAAGEYWDGADEFCVIRREGERRRMRWGEGRRSD